MEEGTRTHNQLAKTCWKGEHQSSGEESRGTEQGVRGAPGLVARELRPRTRGTHPAILFVQRGDISATLPELCKHIFLQPRGNSALTLTPCINLENGRPNKSSLLPLFSHGRPQAKKVVSRLDVCQHALRGVRGLCRPICPRTEQTVTKAVASLQDYA